MLATWLEPAGEGHRLRFARWRDGAWSAPVTITEGAGIVANWADVPAIAEAGDGALVATWAEAIGGAPYAYAAIAARSIDGGAVWTRLGALHDDETATEHGFVSMVGEPGGVRAFWLDGRETAREGGAMTLRTAQIGDAITAGAVVDSRVCDCCGTAATATADGPLVVYRNRTDDEVRDIHVARRDGTEAPVHRDGWEIRGCPVNGPAIAARDRAVAVAWYTYAESVHRVRVAFSKDGGESFGAPIDVDGPRGPRSPLGRVAIVLDDDGGAIVGWFASAREEGAILVRRVGRDGALGAEIRVGESVAGRDAGFPRLARAGAELVVVWTAPGDPARLRAVRLSTAALSATAVTSDTTPAVAALRADETAPAIALTALDGDEVTLAALRGKVVLVNLWATWCEPCRHELTELAAIHERDGGRGLVVVGLNVDRASARVKVVELVRRRKVPFAVWLDPADRASAAFGATTFPVNVLVDRDGIVRWRRDGAITAGDPELRAAIEDALAAAPQGDVRTR